MSSSITDSPLLGRDSNIFIYGSCVSRDTFECMQGIGANLIQYTARQSLISAMSEVEKPSDLLKESALTSSFQRTSLEGDLTGSLRRDLVSHMGNADILLVDFVDERSGVFLGENGAYITNSQELTNSGVLEHWNEKKRLISFGSDEHFKLWTLAFDKFVELLDESNLLDRLVVIKNQWALESKEGDVFPIAPSTLRPARMNDLYSRYFAYVAHKCDCLIIDPPVELCVSTREHKWGMAPFHYVASFYHFVRGVLSDDRVRA